MRRLSDKNLFWWKGPPANFGDLVGPYLFRKITGREPRWRRPANLSLSTVFVTAGSLGRWIREDSIVWGTGIIRRDQFLFRPADVLAVRGPHTRARFLELGYPCPDTYGDPGILLPLFHRPRVEQVHRLGVIPHYVDLEEAKERFGARRDVKVIDVRRPVEAVVDDIVSCAAVVSSSLHGLLTAHAYRIPAARIEFSRPLAGDGIKFDDYYESASVRPPQSLSRIMETTTAGDLERLAWEAPLPDVDHLAKPLLDACPFA